MTVLRVLSVLGEGQTFSDFFMGITCISQFPMYNAHK
jgi:hypothetical protein